MNGEVISPEELSRIRYDLELFLMGGPFDLYEDARLIATVHCWPGGGRSLLRKANTLVLGRRVVAVLAHRRL